MMMMTENEIVELKAKTEEYALYISEQNYRREKFMLLFRSIVRPGAALSTVIDSFLNAFDVKNAAGAQLDDIGALVGVGRTLAHAPSEGGINMDDDEFRTMILMKIARNFWDGTNQGAADTYKAVLGDGFTFAQSDNQDMSVSIACSGLTSSRIVEILTYTSNLLVPAGVLATITVNGEEININMETDVIISGSLLTGSVTAD